MNYCCEEGRKYTDGLCWVHTHKEVTFINSKIEEQANEPEEFINEKTFYKKLFQSKPNNR